MDVNQIGRDISWYIEEIRRNEEDLNKAKNSVMDLEEKIRTNKQKLESLNRDLASAESLNHQNKY